MKSVWRVEFDERARRELKNLGPSTERTIVSYLLKRLATEADPRRFGKPLAGYLHGTWRWRVGDYRILGEIHEGLLVVLVVRVGNRKDVYDI